MIAEYWRVDSLIGNDGIQNNDSKSFLWDLLKSTFSDKRKEDKTDKSFKMRPMIEPSKFEIFRGTIKW